VENQFTAAENSILLQFPNSSWERIYLMECYYCYLRTKCVYLSLGNEYSEMKVPLHQMKDHDRQNSQNKESQRWSSSSDI